jgi:hypothetical protein
MGGEAALFLRRDGKRGIRHAQGSHNSLLEKRIQGLAGNHFYQAAQKIGGDAVIPFGARGALQGPIRQPVEVMDLVME